MKFRNKTNSEVAINLTPLIDVVFLLLIFFMVSTTFKKNTQLSIVLPKAAAEPKITDNRSIRVTIDNHGLFELDGQLYSMQGREKS